MADGVELWWCRVGLGPPVVLLPGRGDSSELYPPEFTDALLDAGFSVVRFDPRDTGLSDDGGDAYRLSDMADDVMTVCSAAGADRVHVVAVSMGGMVAVDLAARHAARVASVVFISAMSPDPQAGIGEAFFAGITAERVAGTLASMGSPSAADEAWVRRNLERARERAPERPEAATRHQLAALRLGWPDVETLGRVTAPALVVHGSADRVLPLAHAHALADGIVASRLHVVDGMGHLPTRAEWLQIAALTVQHLRATD